VKPDRGSGVVDHPKGTPFSKRALYIPQKNPVTSTKEPTFAPFPTKRERR